MIPGRIVAAVCLFAALVVTGLATPLYLGKVSMNKAYGVRFQRAFESEEMWLKANRLGGKVGIVCGALYAAVCVAFLFFPPRTRLGLNMLSVSPVAMALAWAITTYYLTRRL